MFVGVMTISAIMDAVCFAQRLCRLPLAVCRLQKLSTSLDSVKVPQFSCLLTTTPIQYLVSHGTSF
jgi:hypothetical protein